MVIVHEQQCTRAGRGEGAGVSTKSAYLETKPVTRFTSRASNRKKTMPHIYLYLGPFYIRVCIYVYYIILSNNHIHKMLATAF